MLAQRAHRAHRNDVGHADALQRVDVGAEVDLGGRNPVAAPVPRQKHHALAVELAAQQFVRRLAERRGDLLPALAGEAVDVVDAAAADDAQLQAADCRQSCRSAPRYNESCSWRFPTARTATKVRVLRAICRYRRMPRERRGASLSSSNRRAWSATTKLTVSSSQSGPLLSSCTCRLRRSSTGFLSPIFCSRKPGCPVYRDALRLCRKMPAPKLACSTQEITCSIVVNSNAPCSLCATDNQA